MAETPQLPHGVYSEGADSFLHGLPCENCPSPPGSDEREAWLVGWNQAARRDARDEDAN
jgi:ribosome modulation factor